MIPAIPSNDPSIAYPKEDMPSWDAFKTFISSRLLTDSSEGAPGDRTAPLSPMPRYLFRGQGDERWNLLSSFDRTFATLEDDKRDEMHKLLISYFVAECAHYPEHEADLEDDSRCLALAQDYGLPTRLLDWSDSPYIAAYYAFSAHLTIDRGKNKSGKDNRVAVWILDTSVRGCWDGQKGVRILSPRATHNERQKRQSGWFTYATMTHRTLEEYVLAMPNKQNSLRKVTLPAAEADLVMRDLNLMRINARELSADLAGAALNALVRAVLT